MKKNKTGANKPQENQFFLDSGFLAFGASLMDFSSVSTLLAITIPFVLQVT
jgi:hypothetical protein